MFALVYSVPVSLDRVAIHMPSPVGAFLLLAFVLACLSYPVLACLLLACVLAYFSLSVLLYLAVILLQDY